jgi:hypothetical protein
MRSALVCLVSVGFFALQACAVDRADPSEASASAVVSPNVPNACPTEEIAFTKETGCQNDGSVEFCIPRGDDAVLASVTKIAPEVRCAGAGGRAGCNPATQVLCFFGTSEVAFPASEPKCVSAHGALTDKAWDQVCKLAALDQVTKVVPTRFE